MNFTVYFSRTEPTDTWVAKEVIDMDTTIGLKMADNMDEYFEETVGKRGENWTSLRIIQ